jgi:hypothetical protein
MICKDDVYCKYNKDYIYDLYYKGFFELLKTTKIVKTMLVAKTLLLRSLLLKDVVVKKWLMLMQKMLMPKDG